MQKWLPQSVRSETDAYATHEQKEVKYAIQTSMPILS